MRTIAIGFHDVVEDCRLAQPVAEGHTTLYTLDRQELRNHLDAVLSQAGQQSVGREGDPAAACGENRVLLTFDDGALSAYLHVAPELEDRGWRGHFFITSDWIGRKGIMDRRQIRDLCDRGHIIGSHSKSHPERISHLGWEEMVREWSESCDEISNTIGRAVKVASVPGGFYSVQVGRAAAAAGIKVLFTSEPTVSVRQVDGCLVVGRYSIRRRSNPRLTGSIAAGEVWPLREEEALWLAKKAAKRLTGAWYCRVRRVLLARSLQHGLPSGRD